MLKLLKWVNKLNIGSQNIYVSFSTNIYLNTVDIY